MPKQELGFTVSESEIDRNVGQEEGKASKSVEEQATRGSAVVDARPGVPRIVRQVEMRIPRRVRRAARRNIYVHWVIRQRKYHHLEKNEFMVK